MSLWKKLLVLGLVLLLLPVAAALAATAAVYSSGTVHLDVDVEDGRFSIPLPAGLLPVAVRFAPHDVCREIEQAEPQWDAMLTAAAAFEEIPDAILVEVHSREDHVTVSKQADRLVVDVTSGSDHVGVSVPSGIVYAVTRSLERTCS
jgi:hypothetical protein